MIKIQALKPNLNSDNTLKLLAQINLEAFHGNKSLASAKLWLSSWFKAYPLYQFFILKVNQKIAGYIVWTFHGGFERENMVVELEQIALAKEFQGQGLGPKLIDESFKQIILWIKMKNSKAKQVTATVWLYDHNQAAKEAYKKLFKEGQQGEREQYGKKELMFRCRKIISKK